MTKLKKIVENVDFFFDILFSEFQNEITTFAVRLSRDHFAVF